jgi:glutamate synthase (NADPH/NADH) large chain
LLLNGLRDRIVVQADGQMKTGRDVIIAALLGAEEFGFATAPLVVSGCVMMRVCHLDTCPVGIATQNPELRKRFNGKPEFVVNFFEYIAQEVREYLAQLGFRTLQEAVGCVEALDVKHAVNHWKAQGLDIEPILVTPQNPYQQTRHHSVSQDHGLDEALDTLLIKQCAQSIETGTPIVIESPISNVNRTVGTMLGSAVTKKWGGAGLADNTIALRFTGSAGQSFGAFIPRGITMQLVGDSNDHVGKGLSGGRISIRPSERATFAPEDNVIAGNVVGYGATSGEVFINGIVGERFAVRNSGATLVVEGVGDHACEYMTGGRVVVLGATGRNFAAGMSGGIAYVFDHDGDFATRVNPEMVDVLPLGDEDVEWLKSTLGEHIAMTGSPLAQRVLVDWVKQQQAFVKVLPRDYARVMAVLAKAAADGANEEETSKRVMESVHG